MLGTVHVLPEPGIVLAHRALRGPCEGWRVLCPLRDVLLAVMCAALCGMDDVVELKLWGEARRDVLRRFLPFERGIPSHDTLDDAMNDDVMNGIDAELLKLSFAAWVDRLRDGQPDIVAVVLRQAQDEGKTARTHLATARVVANAKLTPRKEWVSQPDATTIARSTRPGHGSTVPSRACPCRSGIPHVPESAVHGYHGGRRCTQSRASQAHRGWGVGRHGMSVAEGQDLPDGTGDGETTIRRVFSVGGRGLHTGRRVRVTVEPAEAGSGVVFRRSLPHGPPEHIPALWRHVVRRPLCTALARDADRPLLTVEHLLAALSALRIDNVVVNVEGDELPIFDGSATTWCDLLTSAGRRAQDAPRSYIRVLRAMEVVQAHRFLRLEPAEELSLDVNIELGGFGRLNWSGVVGAEIFRTDIAPARSFGRLKWALPLKLYSLARRQPVLRGAHLGTTAVLWGGGVVGGMRVPDEPVRHRALDLIGDLSLAGRPLLAHVTARHVGHEVNNAMVRKLMSDPDAWEACSRGA